jgi:hypothetical protein
MKNALKYILGTEPYNEQRCKLRRKGKYNNIIFLNVYVPTEDKEEFYEVLQTVVDKVPKCDIVM